MNNPNQINPMASRVNYTVAPTHEPQPMRMAAMPPSLGQQNSQAPMSYADMGAILAEMKQFQSSLQDRHEQDLRQIKLHERLQEKDEELRKLQKELERSRAEVTKLKRSGGVPFSIRSGEYYLLPVFTLGAKTMDYCRPTKQVINYDRVRENNSNQKWCFELVSAEPACYYLKNQHTGNYLVKEDVRDRDHLTTYVTTGNSQPIIWEIRKMTGTGGRETFQILERESGGSLNVDRGNRNNYARIVINYDNKCANNELFYIEEAERLR